MEASIELLECADCNAIWSLRPHACAACGGTRLFPRSAAGGGIVRARSEVARAPDAYWATQAPYVLVLVRLDEGPTVMGHADPDVAIGQRVRARALQRDERRLLCFGAADGP